MLLPVLGGEDMIGALTALEAVGTNGSSVSYSSCAD